MNRTCRLSNVTQRYLSTFQCILDEMIHGMTQAGLTDSISHNFIVQMIPHHQAAIEMSQNILQYTTNIPLQEIATCIIDEQTESIAQMERALDCCARMINEEEEVCRYQNQIERIMNDMFCAMENAPQCNNVNISFIREMIPHHLGAVRMSELLLKQDICPELCPIAEAILVSQKRGIRQMQRLLRCIAG